MKPRCIVDWRQVGLATLLSCSLAVGQQSPNGQVKQSYDAGDPAAIAVARRAIDENTAMFGPNSQQTAISLNNLGILLRNSGDLKSAESLLQRAVQILITTSSESPDLASAMTNLGTVMEAEGNFGEAEGLYQKALSISKLVYGPRHPAVGSVLQRLGHLYYETQRYGQAQATLREALAVNEAALGPVDITTARILVDLARTSAKMGNSENANVYLAQAARILKSISESGQCGSNSSVSTCRDADALRREIGN